MYYEINVSLHGQHLFATHQRSLTSASDMRNLYKLLVEKFPKAEGYVVDVYRKRETGQLINPLKEKS